LCRTARKGLKVRRALPVPKALPVRWARRALKDHPVHQDLRAQVNRGPPVLRVLRALKGLKVLADLKDRQGLQGRTPRCRDLKVHRDLRAIRDPPGLKATTDRSD